MGRIKELFPGSDGKTRVAKVKVKDGVITCPLQRLFSLEISTTVDSPVISEILNHPSIKKQTTEDLAEVITRAERVVKKPQFYQSFMCLNWIV